MAKPRSKVSPKNREVPARQQQTQRAPSPESIPRLPQTRSQDESFAGGAAKTQMKGWLAPGARVYQPGRGRRFHNGGSKGWATIVLFGVVSRLNEHSGSRA